MRNKIKRFWSEEAFTKSVSVISLRLAVVRIMWNQKCRIFLLIPDAPITGLQKNFLTPLVSYPRFITSHFVRYQLGWANNEYSQLPTRLMNRVLWNYGVLENIWLFFHRILHIYAWSGKAKYRKQLSRCPSY